MIHTLKWFLQNPRLAWWKHALLGGAIAISPALVLGADKDKDKDKDRSNKHGQTSSARQADNSNPPSTGRGAMPRQKSDVAHDGASRGGSDRKLSNSSQLNRHDPRPNDQSPFLGGARTMTAKGGSNKAEDGGNRANFRSVDDSNKRTVKPGDSSRFNQQSESFEKKNRNATDIKAFNRQIDDKKMSAKSGSNKFEDERNPANSRFDNDSNKKTVKPSDLKELDRHPESNGKKNSGAFDLKGRNGQIEIPKDLSGKGGKKSVKPGDLKDLDRHGDVAKPADLHDKNSHNDSDPKFAHGDSKKDDGKKGGNFLEQHKNGKFDGVVKGAVAKKLDLGKQFELKHKGDLTLQLKLAQKIKLHGGWSKSHWAGLVGPRFGAGCSPIVYCGPAYFPSHCLYPGWSPWVEYCWGFHCEPVCDPRPWFCRPWKYDPCPVWVSWDYPVWYELPVVTCGTWVDVEPVVIDEGLDLQLLAVRFVDPGQPELREGPRYRVWARNNSARTVIRDFNIVLMAANSREAVAGLPQAGVRVDSMEPGEVKAFDIRLPFESTLLGRDREGHAMPFSQLHALVDSHREVPEAFEENNGAVIARGDILPVDPVIFGTDSATPLPGTEINIAGEGFGPEPGQILVHVGGIELQAEIEGWYDLGVRVRLPSLALAGPTEAELVLIRGDTAASNPLTVQLTMPVASR